MKLEKSFGRLIESSCAPSLFYPAPAARRHLTSSGQKHTTAAPGWDLCVFLLVIQEAAAVIKELLNCQAAWYELKK